MSSKSIRIILILGILTVTGMLGIQVYFLYLNADIQKKEFNQRVMIGLRNVADSLAARSAQTLPGQDVVQRMSGNHYAVNINQVIDANWLEYYLFEEFKKRGLTDDFDYGIYDCFSDEFVFGNCCSFSGDDEGIDGEQLLPKYEDLNYYFVVSFPNKSTLSLFTGIPKFTWIFIGITILAALFFIYAMSVILRQKRLSELQRDFINNMTHEFKTPIASIKLAADGLANHLSGPDERRLNKYAQIIQEQNQRLNHQVEKVLNLARSERDSFELKMEDLDLGRQLEDILENFSIRTQQENVTLETEIDQRNFFIKADRLHLMNVIDTILDNAVKYGGEQPKVRVTLKKRGKFADLSIRDWGIGMEKDELQKIFNKFYRVPMGNVHNVKGFGLGLFYVKKIVKAHSWNISVDSEKGKGTQFQISFPMLEQQGSKRQQ